MTSCMSNKVVFSLATSCNHTHALLTHAPSTCPVQLLRLRAYEPVHVFLALRIGPPHKMFPLCRRAQFRSLTTEPFETTMACIGSGAASRLEWSVTEHGD